MTDRPYQMLPPLDPDQRHLLRQSIEANGVLEPVVFDEDGEILDGHHRVEIAEELDIDYPRRVVTDLDEAGKRRYAITTNVARRQLVPAVRSALVAQLRTQGMSIRQIAEATGLPKSTVSDDLRQLSDTGQLDQPERITGADGRERPATHPPKTPEPDGAVTAPPSGSGIDGPGLGAGLPAVGPILAGAVAQDRAARTEPAGRYREPVIDPEAEELRQRRVATHQLCETVVALAQMRGFDTGWKYDPGMALPGRAVTGEVIADARQAIDELAKIWDERKLP